MKPKLVCMLLSFLMLLFFCGCAAHGSSTGGRDFDSSKVGQIQKGVTTSAQALTWFGEPLRKEVVSANEIKWYYGWAQATANVVHGPFGSRKIDTRGTKKNLWLFIKDDVVLN